MRSMVVGLAALMLAGCATVKVARFVEETYPPTTAVQVMRTPPQRPYVELAEMRYRINNRDPQEAIDAFREKAKELGADAVLLTADSGRGAVMIPSGSLAVAAAIRDATAVAIKYR